MTRRLREEIQQTKPFDSLEEEVYVEILRTSQATYRWIVEALRETELSPTQFNVLRILRGAGPGGLPSARIAERMISHDPDLTRLLDRLEKRGMVEKARDTKDRRVVNACITGAGLAAVETATHDVRERLKVGMRNVGRRELGQLADLLESVRATKGDDHGHEAGSRSRHGSDRQAGRSDRAGVARPRGQGAGDDAAPGVGRGKGAEGGRRRGRAG